MILTTSSRRKRSKADAGGEAHCLKLEVGSPRRGDRSRSARPPGRLGQNPKNKHENRSKRSQRRGNQGQGNFGFDSWRGELEKHHATGAKVAKLKRLKGGRPPRFGHFPPPTTLAGYSVSLLSSKGLPEFSLRLCASAVKKADKGGNGIFWFMVLDVPPICGGRDCQ